MDFTQTVRLDRPTTALLQHIDTRDAAVWILDAFIAEAEPSAAASITKLPWRLALSESANPQFLLELERAEQAEDSLVRRRGFIQLVDSNPADVLLPPRCLPIYLLNGRDATVAPRGLAAMTRRLTMLDALRRLQLKELVVLAGSGPPLPPELTELWNEGFRPIITVVGNSDAIAEELEAWRAARPFGATTAYLPLPAARFCADLHAAYLSDRIDGRTTLRLRKVSGDTQLLDVTGLDDPEHPLLANYELLQESVLRPLQPDDLKKEETEDFFIDPSKSWRPYAAGMPWKHDDDAWQIVRNRLRRLDREGPDANRITFISAESGAGGTTLLRQLAWSAATEGYPTLIAGSAPFSPKALEVGSFMSRVLDAWRKVNSEGDEERRYETPWLLAFDRMHWEGRTAELRAYLRELARMGRSACILIVSGPYRDFDFFDGSSFIQVAALSHQVPLDDAVSLGRHLNRYLRPHGPVRTETEWRTFYEASAVQAQRGIAAFWIALSFWVQRQFDMKETVQSWIYRQFKEKQLASDVRMAILDIAALSSERHPLPESMLPRTIDWPVSQKLEDIRQELSALGLARIARDGDRYWLMAHDVIGRYLLTALFYDRPALEAAGFGHAQNPEHLRFQVLRGLSQLPALGQPSSRVIAEEFAISIFKIDPDHGHANFALYWREVLAALDSMPKALHATSRSFRHHTAISRRRIAKLKDDFPTTSSERVDLLERAISDIRYALDNIPATSDSETDINLYNSLAHAYQDLEEEEIERGVSSERIAELRRLAHDATLRAYRENPDNSFVVETYARSLLNNARAFPDKAAENAIEVLNIVYSAMDRDRSGQRRTNLSRLADAAMALLLMRPHQTSASTTPLSEIEAIVGAIQALVAGVNFEGIELREFPSSNRIRAAEQLAAPVLQGNAQAVRLRYALACLDAPYDFRRQLELLESLRDSGVAFSPQMRLELALLLQQCDRHHEADRMFRDLRRLWREGDHYVEVPDRLRWLLTMDGRAQRQVTAKVMGSNEHRRAAKVRELQDTEVLFRAEEFGRTELRPGSTIRGFISFGHNGPFLRPTTATLN